MAKTKNIEAYCGFCNAVKKMELAGETSDGDSSKRWAKCKSCKQKTVIDLNDLQKETKLTIQNIVVDGCKEYSPKEHYAVGETIFHRAFNDHGIILGKETSSNGKGLIIVEFQNSGKKKLLETINNQQI